MSADYWLLLVTTFSIFLQGFEGHGERELPITVSHQISTRYLRRDLSDFDDIRLNKEQYDKVQNLHYMWYLHTVKALIGQMGKELYQQLPLGGSNHGSDA